ncbi:MAG: CPBP family intramembrane metalloprotease [Candidatus Nomurabacteria bacterium]|jgi:membrane protease YdiL (CAAX protease family)|nr:CPBP family intramembrane metalloprotease [Candidatus Nomurabacteria bacterium]
MKKLKKSEQNSAGNFKAYSPENSSGAGKKSPQNLNKTSREVALRGAAPKNVFCQKKFLGADEATVPAGDRSKFTPRKFFSVVGWLAWLTFAYFAAQFAIALILVIWRTFGGPINLNNLSDLGETLLDAAIYAAILAIAVGGAWLSRRRLKLKNFWQLIGLSRRPKLIDLKYLLAGIPIYYVLLIAMMIAARIILAAAGSGAMNQTQDVGFATSGNSPGQLVIIFVALVIVPPIAEEIAMRGFLFGRLRKILSFWPTAILVSLLFAVAHWQLNVSLDTFTLSMVMCVLREKTGTIYPTIGLHIVKNLVAFCALFL